MPGVREVLREPGHSLAHKDRKLFEPQFGHDLSRVRVHEGESADRSARALNARAYTVGQHIVFGRGEYRPDDRSGQAVLAHELAHVVQQSRIAIDPERLTVGPRGGTRERAASTAASYVLAGRSPLPCQAGVSGEIQRDEPVPIDVEVETPQEAAHTQKQGLNLPNVSTAALDPRTHSDFLDRRVEAVGFGIYLGGYHLHVSGLDLPVFLPYSYVAQYSAVRSVDNVIYNSREAAQAAIPIGPQASGQAFPMTYFRGVGGLIVPAYVTPGSAPRTYKTMIEAQRELGRQVSDDLTELALDMVGGLLIKGVVGVIRRVAGRARPTPPADPPPTLNTPKPGPAHAQPTGDTKLLPAKGNTSRSQPRFDWQNETNLSGINHAGYRHAPWSRERGTSKFNYDSWRNIRSLTDEVVLKGKPARFKSPSDKSLADGAPSAGSVYEHHFDFPIGQQGKTKLFGMRVIVDHSNNFVSAIPIK